MLVQARPAPSADQSLPLLRLLSFRLERPPGYPADAATQPQLLLRGAHGLLRRL